MDDNNPVEGRAAEGRRVTESKNGYPMLVEYYRRTGSVGGERWIYDRSATVDQPLHLVLDTAHAVVNAR